MKPYQNLIPVLFLLLTSCIHVNRNDPASDEATNPDTAALLEKTVTDYTPQDLSYPGFNPFAKDADTILVPDLDSMLIGCFKQSVATGNTDQMCFYDALDKADTLIRREYENLCQKLNEPERAALKKAQERWTAYFHQEAGFLQNTFRKGDKYGHGAEHPAAATQWTFQVARQRLIMLRVFSREIQEPDK